MQHHHSQHTYLQLGRKLFVSLILTGELTQMLCHVDMQSWVLLNLASMSASLLQTAGPLSTLHQFW